MVRWGEDGRPPLALALALELELELAAADMMEIWHWDEFCWFMMAVQSVQPLPEVSACGGVLAADRVLASIRLAMLSSQS